MRSFRLYSNIPALPCNKVWAEIDEKALVNNYKLLCEKTPGVKHVCVVKADAYGHASAICVSALLDAGCDFFAVSCIEEAIEVRRLCSIRNQDAKVLILGYTDPRFVRQLSEHGIIQTVVDYDHAKALEDAAKHEGCKVQVHIALDTGMNRIGLCARNEKECQEAAETVKTLVKSPNLAVKGMFTHFATADEEDSAVFTESSATKAQFERFSAVRNALKDSGIRLFCHVCNSAAAVRFPEFALDGVRLGILLYGVRPSDKMVAETKPVMSLNTVISHIHPLSAGDKVSYGGKYEADSDKMIATLPIGYADGFIRAYSGAKVTVHTEKGDFKAPIIGRICMDQCMIDVTGIPAETGDRVTVFGCSPEELSDLAAIADTIEYEVLCLISGRVPRITKRSTDPKNED